MKAKNLFASALVLLALLFSAQAPAAERQCLRGHLPSSISQLAPSGRLPATNSLALAIGLPLRNTNELAALLKEISDPASPQFRHYLTPQEFTERFGPTERDYRDLVDFAKANGLKVTGTHPNRMLLEVTAPVADIESVFHVNLRTYQHPKEARTFYAPDAEPSLALAVPVIHISGLDNFKLPRPLIVKRSALNSTATPPGGPSSLTGATSLPSRAGTKNGEAARQPAPAPLLTVETNAVALATGSGPYGAYMGNDFRAAYIPGVSLNGAGQSVGLLEFDGYYTNDVVAYESQAGLPSVPLNTVLLDGFNGVPGGANIEVALDIDMAISMAPGLSSVIVYEGLATDSILNRMANDNLAKQLSASWTYPIDATSEQIFQQFAAQGQSFFNASGDSDAWTGPIPSPADDPYITIVGGTTLTTSGPGGSWLSESVWNLGTFYDYYYGVYYGVGSGGGISTTYPIPSWQQGISMTVNGGSTTMRNVPDVALIADNIFVIADGGYQYTVGGTSAATPLWAAFTSLVNQQAAANGKPSAGFLNPAIYALGQQAAYTLAFHDITTGSNSWLYSFNNFNAVPGYDLCTGWGTLNGSNTIAALVEPNDFLEISPGLGFAASGPPGGPFAPSSQVYFLKNGGDSPLNWALINTCPWLSVSASSGQLAAGALPANITVSLNGAATNLSTGIYSATILFYNLNTFTVQSRQFILQVAATPVAIYSQPVNQTVLVGGAASFSVRATGSDLHYYWQKNGAALADNGHIAGSATPSLSINNVALADAGLYSVTVSNVAGAVSSSIAALFVVSPGGPQLVQNGGFETGTFAGWSLTGNSNLVAVATNAAHSGAFGARFGTAGSLAYISQTLPTLPGSLYAISAWLNSPDGASPNEFLIQWGGNTLFDSANMGAHGWSNFQFLVPATNSGTVLQLGLRDDPSFLALDDVSVTLITSVASPPIFTKQPLGQMLVVGGSVSFSAAASGTTPLSYQWRHNGLNLTDGGRISGSTSSQLSISNVSVADAGTYSVVASNAYGSAASSDAALVILPSGAEVVTFDSLPETTDGLLVPSGYAGLNWNNFFELDGLGFETLDGPSGYSSGVVSPKNVVFNGNANPAYILSRVPFNLHAAYLTAAWNDNLQVEVLGFTGSNTPAYDNTYTVSSTNPTLISFNYSNLTELEFISSGGTPHPGYIGAGGHFVMDNLAVSFSSTGPLSIIAQPSSQGAFVGQTAVFNVVSSGSPPLTYQWQENGTNLTDGGNISGSTTATLTISNITVASAGVYSVIVGNGSGTVSSSGAALSVLSLGPNLVLNGGFENGNFSPWSQAGDTKSSFVTTNAAYVHSGHYGAQLGPEGGYFELYQYDSTIPGRSYLISLWFNNQPPPLSSSDYNEFDVYWDGFTLYSQSDLGIFGWTNLQFIALASSYSTTLEFDVENDPAYFGLDDISVQLISPLANPPVITNLPVAQVATAGGTATFLAGAGGSYPLSYQWSLNGTNLTDGVGISGSTSPRLLLAGISQTNTGAYSLRVSNPYGVASSPPVSLTLLPAGEQLINFDDLPVTSSGIYINNYRGLNWSNFVEIDATNPNSYYQPAAGLGMVSPGNVAIGLSTAALSSGGGAFDLISAWLTADYTPSTLQVTAFTGLKQSYHASYDLDPSGPTLVAFNFTNVTQVLFQSTGSYDFIMDNVVLSINPASPPLITSVPVGQAVQAGSSAGFVVSAIGTFPISYQWRFNGVNLSDSASVSGSATPRLLISKAGPANVGAYSAVASNPYGAATSSVAALDVYVGGTNLLQNGGFETGDFTGWSLSGDSKGVGVGTGVLYAHSGHFGAQLSPYDVTSLSQTIPTTPGTSYEVSFWLRPDGNGSSFASWNGTALAYPSYIAATFWTNVQIIVAATTPSSTLQFQFEDYASTYMGFDDVTVSNLVYLNYSPSLPPACISPQLANGAFQFSFQTVLGQSYTIQQCPDLTSGYWTPYSSFMGDGNVYEFSVPVLGSQPAAYFRVRQP